MTKEEKIQNQFAMLKKGMPALFPLKVVAVDVAKKTFTGVDRFDIKYDDVQLSSSVINEKTVLVVPSVNSWVQVSAIENQENELVLMAYDKLDDLMIDIGSLSLSANANGIKLNCQGENLKNTLVSVVDQVSNVCDELKKVVVAVGVTPNVPAIELIRQELNTVIKPKLEKLLR